MASGFDDSSPVLDFLEFVERQPQQSVRQLLDKILLKSRMITGAEAGTVFIVRRKGQQRWLQPASMQNERIRPKLRDLVVPITAKTIAGYVAGAGEAVRLDDVYAIPPDRPFSFNPQNELKGYRTVSMLAFPLKNYQDQVIGVVQLINRRQPALPEPVPFEAEQTRLVTPIARAIATHIERADMLERIREQNVKLHQRNRELAEQRAQVVALQGETEEAFMLSINLLARAAEIHDEETGNHILRVNEYSYFLARELDMPASFCDEIRYSAQLHDVGKMSINTAILTKRGKLTPEERAEMDRHPHYGHQILAHSPRLTLAAEIAYCHHEKWDGSGYPRQLQGEAIPISARIVALADVYDALRSARPYKPAFSHERTVEIILQGDERIEPRRHFDPKLIQLFGEQHAGMAAIYQRLKD
ncbi:MAG: HD domain-containing protein [Alphaproteobacteria bacterium]|nr:HD domain-containing protein [Alphaproteobacteria bacterium]